MTTMSSDDDKPIGTSAIAGSPKSSARIIGSAVAGVSELALFHPVDTVAKRLMATEAQLITISSPSQTFVNLNGAIFRSAALEGPLSKVTSLFPGVGFGAAYKILQRIYKFGGQPVVLDRMTRLYGAEFDERFGHKTGRTLLSATSGSLIGIGEVALLPLDAMKVKAQTAPEQIKGRGVVDIFRSEGLALYRGAGLTAMRNAPGSFALFGGNTAAKTFMGVGEAGQRATWTQDAVASCVGATASITVAQPLGKSDIYEVIASIVERSSDRTPSRCDKDPRSSEAFRRECPRLCSPETGASIFKRLIQNEGVGALFKGLTPKLLVVGPKLVFSFTIAQHMIGYFEQALK
ncbi:hypothetical protein THAOC_13397 [Thalassiosira oceanica]|uniref:Mitochondrial carrier protein n=1 Tax=Thalassiosira oceanica TaxID=159749 RepID=K0SL88_THAOC|nr:hypothetical protein THAOC_13397 [Thalassiosira oceanica]|eukprot:EJK65719.1 hypothetical protein THAOC_13397 [Thalassiosira oceanica]